MRVLGLAALAGVVAMAQADVPQAPPAAAPATTARALDFERDVMPILQEHCVNCHSASDAQGELVMETHEDLMRGGEHGAAVVAGKADQSRLVAMVEGRMKPKMPPKKELPADALAVIKAWIEAGAEASPLSAAAARIPDIKPRVSRPSPVYAVAFSPDGATLAVGGHKQARLFDAATGALRRTLEGPADLVRALAFSPDGKWLAAGGGQPSRAGEVVIWDAATGEKARTIEGHRDSVYALAFSPNGRFLATASYDRYIRLWYVSNGRERAKLREHLDAVFALAFSPDGKWLASGAGDRTVKVWDVQAGARLFTLSDALDTVYAVAFHPSGEQLSAGGGDRLIRTWDLAPEGGTLAFSTIAHEDAIVGLAYAPDGKQMVTASADGMIKVWDVEKKAELRLLPRQPDWPMALALDAAGRRVAVGRYDGTVGVYDLASGRLQAELLGRAGRASLEMPSAKRKRSAPPSGG